MFFLPICDDSVAWLLEVGEFLDGEANRIAKERSLEEAVMFLAQWRTQDFFAEKCGMQHG